MVSQGLSDKVMKYYEEYKETYDKHNIIGIMLCECDDYTMLAHTNNEELMNCIKNESDVTLYISPKFKLCSEQYIKAVLFHEFTHISDAYNFVGDDNSIFLMNTYSEYNATRIEIIERCRNKSVVLDEAICGEKGNITLREEIEDKIDTIIMILEIAKKDSQKMVEDKMDSFMFDNLIKAYSYLLAYLSFVEETEPNYFEDCFNKINEYEQFAIGKRIYNDVQCLDKILNNPEIIIGDIVELYKVYFE